MLIAILTLIALNLAVSGVDLILDYRSAKPARRRKEQLEDARRAVAAAEQLYRGAGKGQDRARAATQQLLDLHPGLKPTRARMLVETAVSEASQYKAPARASLSATPAEHQPPSK